MKFQNQLFISKRRRISWSFQNGDVSSFQNAAHISKQLVIIVCLLIYIKQLKALNLNILSFNYLKKFKIPKNLPFFQCREEASSLKSSHLCDRSLENIISINNTCISNSDPRKFLLCDIFLNYLVMKHIFPSFKVIHISL